MLDGNSAAERIHAQSVAAKEDRFERNSREFWESMQDDPHPLADRAKTNEDLRYALACIAVDALQGMEIDKRHLGQVEEVIDELIWEWGE